MEMFVVVKEVDKEYQICNGLMDIVSVGLYDYYVVMFVVCLEVKL